MSKPTANLKNHNQRGARADTAAPQFASGELGTVQHIIYGNQALHSAEQIEHLERRLHLAVSEIEIVTASQLAAMEHANAAALKSGLAQINQAANEKIEQSRQQLIAYVDDALAKLDNGKLDNTTIASMLTTMADNLRETGSGD